MKRWIVPLLLLIWTTATTAAGVYKWVDEQGNVHYGERPPTKAQASELAIANKPTTNAPAEDEAARVDQQQRLLRAYEEEREQKKVEREKSKEEKAKRERSCIQARDQLRRFEEARYLYELDAKGERRALTDAERARSEQRKRDEVKKWCN